MSKAEDTKESDASKEQFSREEQEFPLLATKSSTKKQNEQNRQRDTREQRLARSKRKLALLLAQPSRRTVAEHRKWLEEFTKIDSTNQPELRARQRRIKDRLNEMLETAKETISIGRPNLSEAQRIRRRALSSGDAQKVVTIANRFHTFVKPLYVSRHAEICYGPGGTDGIKWGNYRRNRRNYPTKWKNAGVWIDYATGHIVFEDFKGKVASRLPLPPMRRVVFDGLEDGDLWGIAIPNQPNVIERWGMSPAIVIMKGYSRLSAT